MQLKSALCLSVFSILLAQATPTGAEIAQTIVHDEKAKQQLLGQHPLSLQWVSWEKFGKVTVSDRNGTVAVKGEQSAPSEVDTQVPAALQDQSTNYLKIDGIITEVDDKQFKFSGSIITRVNHINHGKECKRNGKFTFALKGHPKYWRMQEINNPCEKVADYVDIYCARSK
jgi:hypothetical protein